MPAQRPCDSAPVQNERIIVVRRAGQFLKSREAYVVDGPGVHPCQGPGVLAYGPNQRVIRRLTADEPLYPVDCRCPGGVADVDIGREHAIDNSRLDHVHLPQVHVHGTLVGGIVEGIHLSGARSTFDPAVGITAVLEDEGVVAQTTPESFDPGGSPQRVGAIRDGDGAVGMDREGQVNRYRGEIQDVLIAGAGIADGVMTPAVVEGTGRRHCPPPRSRCPRQSPCWRRFRSGIREASRQCDSPLLGLQQNH